MIKIINSIYKIFLELFIFDKKLRAKLKARFAKLYLKKYVDFGINCKINKNKNRKDEKIIWQYWQGGLKEEALVKEINAGRTVIMSPAKPYYLDLPYSENTLQAIAEYKDVPEGADPDRILGLEFPLWTELVPDEETAERRLFPRLLLMAEKAWRGECESSFLYRCEAFGKVLTDLGATIKKKVPLPPKGLKGLLDVMWFNRCRLYWGAIPNLIRNAKVAKIAKQRIKETENEK